MNIIERLNSPTPKFFRVLRTIGLALAAAGGSLLAAPVALPTLVTSIAAYVVVAGTVMTAVSQTTVQSDDPDSPGDVGSQ